MTYKALALQFRPETFADVVAQEHVTETLLAAVAQGRVASAYLFSGPRGSGKTTVARLLAKAVNCDKPVQGEPCTKCDPCRNIKDGKSLDVLEIDGASNNSVDDVRELRENVRYAASAPGKRKVYIVDEVHMLSAGAFNALLKTLEEPPAHVVFVLATTEARKVPATILSRCQRFDFRRLSIATIQDRLQWVCKEKDIDIDADALFALSKHADGSLRDGLSLLDQVSSGTDDRIDAATVATVLGLVREDTYLDVLAAVASRDAKRAIELLHEALGAGADPGSFALGLVEHLRNLLLLATDASLAGSVQLADEHLKRAIELAARFRQEDLLHLLNRMALIYEDVRTMSSPSLILEAAMVELARFESRVLLRDVLDKLGSGGDPAPGGGAETAGQRRRSDPGPPARVRRAEAPAERAGPRGAADGPTPGQVERRAAAPEPAVGGPPTWRSGSSAAGRAPGGPLDLSVVRAHWEPFTRVVQQSRAMVAQCLADGQPEALEGSVLRIGFPTEHSFHTSLLQDPTRTRELEEIFQAYFGQRLTIRVGAAQAERPAATARISPQDVAESRRAAAADILQSTPRLREILDAFDGEILDDTSAV
jgi:DNA polymerase-3 subunit gamma/tau